MGAIAANNPGRPIPGSKVLGFQGINATNAWLLANPERTTAIVHFLLDDPTSPATTTLSYSLQTNSSIKVGRGAGPA